MNTEVESDAWLDHIPLIEIRKQLEELENEILFAFVKRAQYFINLPIYLSESVLARNPSFLECVLKDVECLRDKYDPLRDTEDLSYFEDTTSKKLKWAPETCLLENEINFNPKIFSNYIHHIVPLLAPPGNSRAQYYAASLADAEILRLLSLRVHLGKHVAHTKFKQESDAYIPLIQKKDTAGILRTLTNPIVEAHILDRVQNKAEMINSILGRDPSQLIGKSPTADCVPNPLNAISIRTIFKNFIIPLTKGVEVEYFYICK